MYLAPAGRHVYSTRHAPNTKAPEGRHVIAEYGRYYLTQGRKGGKRGKAKRWFTSAFSPRGAACL